MNAVPISVDALRATLAPLLEEEPEDLHDETNLIECGLDSIMLMRLVADWRRTGYDVNVAALAERPTLGAWSRLLTTAPQGPVTAPQGPVTASPGPVAVAQPERSAAADADRPLGSMQHAFWV